MYNRLDEWMLIDRLIECRSRAPCTLCRKSPRTPRRRRSVWIPSPPSSPPTQSSSSMSPGRSIREMAGTNTSVDCLRIGQRIQQGRPFSFVSKCVHNNHRLERLLANQMTFLQFQFTDWSIPWRVAGCVLVVRYLVVSWFPEVNM